MSLDGAITWLTLHTDGKSKTGKTKYERDVFELKKHVVELLLAIESTGEGDNPEKARRYSNERTSYLDSRFTTWIGGIKLGVGAVIEFLALGAKTQG